MNCTFWRQARDGAAAEEAAAVAQQHDLEQDARALSGGTGGVVAKARVEGAPVKFVIDQVIEHELEAAGQELFAQHYRQKPGTTIHRFVAGHRRPRLERCTC